MTTSSRSTCSVKILINANHCPAKHNVTSMFFSRRILQCASVFLIGPDDGTCAIKRRKTEIYQSVCEP